MSHQRGGPTARAAGDRGELVDYRRGTLRGWPRAIVRWCLLQAVRPFIKLTIVGLATVPDSAPFLFVANHVHNADPILLEMAITRPIHFMAKQELFRNRVLAWLIRRTGAFPVDRGRPDRAAIRHAEALLAQGIAVGMFPEGTRSRTGMLQPAFPGVGLIAVRSQADILPASIIGTELLPLNGTKGRERPAQKRTRFRRHQVTIRFGTPFSLPSTIGGSRISAAQATDLMMGEIARLLPACQRGAYQMPADSLITVRTGTGQDVGRSG